MLAALLFRVWEAPSSDLGAVAKLLVPPSASSGKCEYAISNSLSFLVHYSLLSYQLQ